MISLINEKKTLYYLHTYFNNNSIINKLNIEDYCYKLDNLKDNVMMFNNYDQLYSIKDNKNKRYYMAFVQEIENMNEIDIVVNKLRGLLENTVNEINNKYYQKFLRRIKYDKITSIFLFIYCKNCDEEKNYSLSNGFVNVFINLQINKYKSIN